MAFSCVGGIGASTTRYYNGERLLFMEMLFAAQPRCATRPCNSGVAQAFSLAFSLCSARNGEFVAY